MLLLWVGLDVAICLMQCVRPIDAMTATSVREVESHFGMAIDLGPF